MSRTLDIHPTEKQYLAYQALNDPDVAEIHFGGAAGGGKSWLGCESRVVRAYQYPGYKSFIGRNQLKRLMASAFITFKKVMKFHKIPETEWRLDGKYNYIEFRNGSRIDLLDLAYQPSDPMYERLGSLEYTDGWIEEAGEVNFMAVDILQSRVGRHLNEEYQLNPDTLYTYNPNKGWVRRIYKQYERGTLPKDVVFIQALYKDNPFTANIYGRQLERMKDPAMKARLKEGSFDYDDDPSALIELDAIDDLFFMEPDEDEDDGKLRITIDVARHGVDKTVIYLWEGRVLIGVWIYQNQDTYVTSQKVKKLLDRFHIPRSRVLVDEDGIGGGVHDQVRGIRGYLGNSSPLIMESEDDPLEFDNDSEEDLPEKENFGNLRSQMHWKMAQDINDRKYFVKLRYFKSEVPGIGLEVFKEFLIEELEAIKSKNNDQDSKKRVRPKEEVKDEIGRSPDFSDAFIMRKWFDYKDSSDEEEGESVYQYRPNSLRK